jgi:FG-GAP repeat
MMCLPPKLRVCRALVLAGLALGGTESFAEDSPIKAVVELVPAAPGHNVQRGFAVAADANCLAMGAPLDDTKGMNAGAVYLLQWSGTLGRWRQVEKVYAGDPQPGARFGSALAMDGGRLAVAALGEGMVRVFHTSGCLAADEQLVSVQGAAPGVFGRALALDGNRLAVGSAPPHGLEAGCVFLFEGPAWGLEKTFAPESPAAGERFGESVALQGDTLAVGAPGFSPSPELAGAGAVYVFAVSDGSQLQILAPAEAGAQVGRSVTIVEGDAIVAGAPAHGGGTNRGAIYAFRREGPGWSIAAAPFAVGTSEGEGLGASLAARGSLVVAGAPLAVTPAGGTGTARVFHRQGDSWQEIGSLLPDNAESLDLAGLAVAVAGTRVVASGVLGDQGGGAAGAVWSFHCSVGSGCTQEGEAVATERAPDERFATALAADPTSGRIAVASSSGTVSVFRPAGDGWRQEARIEPPADDQGSDQGSAFGSALAVHGDWLAVGAPHAGSPAVVSPPTETPDTGAVFVFHRSGTSWTLEDRLLAPQSLTGDRFGAALALSAAHLAVGAPGAQIAGPSSSGAVFVFSPTAAGSLDSLPETVVEAEPHQGAAFGSSVALAGEALAIGAPGENLGAGAVYAVDLDGTCCRASPLGGEVAIQGDGLGSAVAVGAEWLAAGAPGRSGTAGSLALFARAGTAWIPADPLIGVPGSRRHFGGAASLQGRCLLVGGTGDSLRGDTGRAFFFTLSAAGWEQAGGDLAAIRPGHGDDFGSAVAVGPRFLAVARPGADFCHATLCSPEAGRVDLFVLREALCTD